MLDGVYQCGADGLPVFVEAGAPTDDELHALLQKVITRLMTMLTRRDVLIEEMGQTYLDEPDADQDEARTLRPLQAAAITDRIAFGPRAGQKVLTPQGRRAQDHRGHPGAAVIQRILDHLGLDPQPPPRARARESGQDFAA